MLQLIARYYNPNSAMTIGALKQLINMSLVQDLLLRVENISCLIV